MNVIIVVTNICVGAVLKEHLLMKNGIGSIQVKLSNCDKCGHNCAIRNRLGSHIQSLHVWTDHMKPDVPVKSLFSTEYEKKNYVTVCSKQRED